MENDTDTADNAGSDAVVQEYVGEGGFIIQCGDGEYVGVTVEQASTLGRACEYFRNIFRHGTKESKERILKKRNWSCVTARHLVELITMGDVSLTSSGYLKELADAAEEVLVDFRLKSLVNSVDVLKKPTTQKFLTLLDPNKLIGKFQGVVKSWQWSELLRQGVLLVYGSDVFVVTIGETTTEPTFFSNNAEITNIDKVSSEYQVYADDRIAAAKKICRVLHRSTLEDASAEVEPRREAFSLTFSFQWDLINPTDRRILKCVSRVKRMTGGVGFQHIQRAGNSNSFGANGFGTNGSGADTRFLASMNVNRYKISGSLVVLNRAFRELRKFLQWNEVALRVMAPSSDTLGRLINACQNCEDHEGTLGLNLQDGEFLVAKTIPDMAGILGFLGDYSNSPIVTGEFTLGQLVPNMGVY